ncbi:MAG: TIGR03915 family putative DNA repair protein [Clostridia bacterium]|nr:TIGR03915 family putative DNA repair protein [Clostridia bacterium]
MIYLIDGSVDGIFTALYNAYQTKTFPTAVVNGDIQLDLCDETVEIQTNKSKADKVFRKLKTILLHGELDKIYTALKSGDECKYTVIFNYLKKTVNENKCISDKFSDTDVFNFDKLVSRVLLEAHRFKGFIRFSKTESGIYYAKYFPDNDVNTLILPHFISRYKSMPFIIHDINHDVISAHFNGKTKTVYKKINPLYVKDEFQSLFKTYYDTVYIKERKNERLMKNFMPKRYHKNLPEKDELSGI